MKLVMTFLIIITAQGIAFSQVISKSEIVGIWQDGTPKLADAYSDCYLFFKDGNFVFHPDQYDGLERIVAIKGDYWLAGDTLYLKVKSTEEKVGGKLERSTVTTLSDTWELYDYKLRSFSQPTDLAAQSISLSRCPAQGVNCLRFNGNAFYKVDDNPDQYH